MTGYRDPSVILQGIKAFHYRDPSNVAQIAKAIHYRDVSNTLRTLYGIGGLTATVSPAEVYGWGYSASPIRVTTGSASASVTGGSGSYTYAWTVPGGSGWTALSPTNSASQFRSPLLSAGGDDGTLATCTITDTATGTTATVSVDVYASNTF